MTTDTERKVRLWEQHGQTIMLFVITGALAFTGNALIDAKTAQAAMAAEMKGMAAQMHRLEGALASMQLQYVSRQEFAVHEQRIQLLESRR